MKKLIINIFSVFIIIILLSTTAYAWYLNAYGLYPKDNVELKSKNSYFASGDGSKEKPYIISHSVHMYNLAWLQYLGQFNHLYVIDDASTIDINETQYFQQYYFEIDANTKMLDMSGIVLPPIGTSKYPFIGNFKGNGCVIKNLHTSNQFSDYNGIHPSEISSVSDISVIGMFGIVGAYKYDTTETTKQTIGCKINNEAVEKVIGTDAYVNCPSNLNTNESIINKVSNFYIDKLTVETIDTNSLVGLLAGYVNAGVSNVGVHASRFNLNSGVTGLTTDKSISEFTLIGDYNTTNISWEEKPSGSGTGGSGDKLAYGGSLDVQKLYQRIALIHANNTTSIEGVTNMLPKTESNSLLAKGSIMPLSVANPITEQHYSTPFVDSSDNVNKLAEIPSSENVGYFCGNQNKQKTYTLNFGDYETTQNGGTYTYSWDDAVVPRALFKRTGQNASKDSNNIMPMTAEEMSKLPENIQNLIPSTNQKVTYNMIQMQHAFDFATVDDHSGSKQTRKDVVYYYGQKYTNVYMPNNGIWIRPKNPGTCRFVVYSNTDGNKFRIHKGKRKELSEAISQDGDAIGETYTKTIPTNILVYFEYEVTQDEINNGLELIVANYDSSKGLAILYIDVGTNGGDDGTGGGTTTDPVDAISGIDFVYLDGTTYTALGEDLSKVVFALSGTSSTTIIYFRRDKTQGVLYYITGSGVKVTPSGSGTSKNSDEADDTFTE